MTCIVGLVGPDGSVYLGGDSAAVDTEGFGLTVRAEPKVFRNGPYVIGFTDSFRSGQLLRHSFEPPVPPAGCDIQAFLVTTFVDSLRTCLQAGGIAAKTADVESGASFLVGIQGRLFTVAEDYSVGEAADGWDAIGCGGGMALGALYASRVFLAPKQRLRVALEAAERGSGGVRRPFRYVRTRGTQ